MSELTVKFWEGRQPPPEYYAPVDPYQDSTPYNIDLPAMMKYAKSKGKKPTELMREEIEQFSTPKEIDGVLIYEQ